MLKVFGENPELTDYLTKAPARTPFELDHLDLFNANRVEMKKIVTIKKIRDSEKNAGALKARTSECTTRVSTAVSTAMQIRLRNQLSKILNGERTILWPKVSSFQIFLKPKCRKAARRRLSY